MKQPINVRMHNEYEGQRAGRRAFNYEAKRFVYSVFYLFAILYLVVLIAELMKELGF